jgi:biopolymer transport protein ExbB/biopolymer transport protein TolQ
MQVWGFLFLQEAVSFDLASMWHHMGIIDKGVVLLMFFMSAWSIGVMIDRWIAYNAARNQSRAFAPAVAGALKNGNLDEAIKVADRFNKSHLAKVVVAGLQEFKAHQQSNEISGETIEASKRALDRAEAIVHAELKRGVPSLATIGSSAPFVGLFGTVVGIINAFRGIATEKATGLAAVAGGISEALVTTAVGLIAAIPAVWAYNYFSNRLEAFDVEMGNSSSELIDYFIKRSQIKAGAAK